MIDSTSTSLKQIQVRSAHTFGSQRRARMSVGLRNAAAAGGLLLSLVSAAWSADATSVEARWQAAEDAYATDHFALALHEFEQLAKLGNFRAAERAGQMLFFGESLYGKAVPRDINRAVQWLAQAAKGGSESSALLLRKISSSAQAGVNGPAKAAADEPYLPRPFGS